MRGNAAQLAATAAECNARVQRLLTRGYCYLSIRQGST